MTWIKLARCLLSGAWPSPANDDIFEAATWRRILKAIGEFGRGRQEDEKLN